MMNYQWLRLSGGMAPSLLCVSWQVVSETYPRQPIFDPGVVARRDGGGLVEAANGDIDFVGVRFAEKREWRATMWAKRTQTTCPFHFTRLSRSETKATSTERRPGHERSATAPTAIHAMTVRDVVRLDGRLIAH